MDKKLTLSLDHQVIEKAKAYARQHRTSLSKMIEAYFASLTSKSEDQSELETTPLVDTLSGVIQLPENFKETRAKYLNEKHK